jgi:hypothetical protein
MDFRGLVEAEISQKVDPRVSAVAAAIAGRHGAASRAVFFYGSCLREQDLDGLMLDFYLIVSDYPAAYPHNWLAFANRLIPPNVFAVTHQGLAAKYAVLSEADFARLNSIDASTASVWARFAQPTRLVWTADEEVRSRAINAICTAAPTLLTLARPIAGDGDLADWRAGFAQTYRSELRAERADRSSAVVDADTERYRQFGAAIETPPLAPDVANRKWRSLRRRGKLLTVLRLGKASLTFVGGIDYLAWKINRHAGMQIVITPWQRRWPLVAALFLVPKLLFKGAVR